MRSDKVLGGVAESDHVGTNAYVAKVSLTLVDIVNSVVEVQYGLWSTNR